MLLFDICHRLNYSYDDIVKLINDKMNINRLRKWSKPNELGYMKHIE